MAREARRSEGGRIHRVVELSPQACEQVRAFLKSWCPTYRRMLFAMLFIAKKEKREAVAPKMRCWRNMPQMCSRSLLEYGIRF